MTRSVWHYARALAYASTDRIEEAKEEQQLFDEALEAGISIAPGHIFSPRNRYSGFIRLSFGHPWSEQTESSIRWLGRRTAELATQ